jgi:hypothetical protein
MVQLTPIRQLDVIHPLYGAHAFVSSASGLVRLGDLLCVIADDAHHLAVFQLESHATGQLIPLLSGHLPSDASERKAVKPDFEILLQLPVGADRTGFRLMALGSGSTVRRMRGVIIELTEEGSIEAITILDLQPLFTALSKTCSDINLEGASIRGDRLFLFNRANMKSPLTTIFSTDLRSLLAGGLIDIHLEKEIQFPRIHGVPLSVTDACRLDNDNTLLCVVAEETGDSYADGTTVASAFVLLDKQFNTLRIDQIEPPIKIEGIAAMQGAHTIEVFCVSDSDDPNRPSSLYKASLQI